MITVTWAECHVTQAALGDPSAVEAQRRVKLILVLRLREGFIDEKLNFEGWVGFYRQGRGI